MTKVAPTLLVTMALFFVPSVSAKDQVAIARILTLSDVLRRVEASYPKILGADAERLAAVAKRVAKQGAFDPVAYSGIDYLRFNSTSARGKKGSTTVSESGIELLTRSGLKIGAGVRRNIGNVKSPLSSTGDIGEFFISAKLPLLRGRRLNEKSVGERQALLGEPLAVHNFALVRLTTLANASVTYWDWAASAQKRIVAENLLTLSEKRAQQIRRRVEKGDLPAIDALEAESEVQRRQGSKIKAERDLQKAAYKLGLYLWEDKTPMDSAPLLSAVQIPHMPNPVALRPADISSARANALRHRPEVLGILLSQEILRLDRDLAQNDRQPNVDLVFSPGLDGGAKGIGQTLKAGVAFSLPLNRREAIGRQEEAQQKLEKLAQEETLLRQQILIEIEDSVSAILTSQERHMTALKEVELAQQLERGEQTRFNFGDSTLFLLNQRERATAEAEARRIDVLAEYQQAVSLFLAASAQL